MRRKPVIAVVGTSREVEAAVSNARALGRSIAEQGWVLITGGRNAGVMRAASEGAKSAKDSLTIGILPDSETEVADAVDVAIVTGIGEARNNIIGLSADAVVACGVDDPGTASEVALALKSGKHVILLQASKTAVSFFGPMNERLVYQARSPQEAVDVLSKLVNKIKT